MMLHDWHRTPVAVTQCPPLNSTAIMPCSCAHVDMCDCKHTGNAKKARMIACE